MIMKTLVIYHSADFDGKFSGAVCYHWLTKMGHEVELKGWDFGDPVIDVPCGQTFYIVDLPYDCVSVAGDMFRVWIDHHKSSIEKFKDYSGCRGLRLDGVAACRLAWQYFRAQAGEIPTGSCEGTTVAEYRDRKVNEPLALTLAGEYDIWDKRDPRTDQFQFGLYCDTWTPERLAETFLSGSPNNVQVWIDSLCAAGEAIMKWQRVFASGVCKSRGFKVELEGNTYWTLASVHARNSSWFPASEGGGGE